MLSHDTIHPVELWILSVLDYFKYHIHEDWERKMNFNENRVYRIKHVKCYRMIPICPVQLWNLSALDYFKYHIHENWEKK